MTGREVELGLRRFPESGKEFKGNFTLGDKKKKRNPFKRLILMQDLGLFQQHLGLPR